MSSRSTFATQVQRNDGSVDVNGLVRILSTNKAELAASLGVSKALLGAPLQRSEETLRRLSALVQILERTTPWVGHPQIAYAWYRSQPLPSFGHMTAEDLLKMGRASSVEAYLERTEAGGYA